MQLLNAPFVGVHAHRYIYIFTCVNACTDANADEYTHANTDAYTYTNTHTHTLIRIYTHIHTYTHIYICTYTFGIYVPTCIIKTSIRLGDVCLETRWMHVPLLIAI